MYSEVLWYVCSSSLLSTIFLIYIYIYIPTWFFVTALSIEFYPCSDNLLLTSDEWVGSSNGSLAHEKTRIDSINGWILAAPCLNIPTHMNTCSEWPWTWWRGTKLAEPNKSVFWSIRKDHRVWEEHWYEVVLQYTTHGTVHSSSLRKWYRESCQTTISPMACWIITCEVATKGEMRRINLALTQVTQRLSLKTLPSNFGCNMSTISAEVNDFKQHNRYHFLVRPRTFHCTYETRNVCLSHTPAINPKKMPGPLWTKG